MEEKVINIEEQKARFLALCAQVKRDGMDRLLKWLETTDFFTAPASTRFHGAYAGGLCEHSLNVYEEYKRLLTAYPEAKVTEESIIVMTLFHDLCKANMYGVEKRNRKNDQGKWESYDAYMFDEKTKYGGHGSKSVFILMTFIKLSLSEARAINCHMSCWDGNMSVGDAFGQDPAAWLLHVADESATYIRESEAL